MKNKTIIKFIGASLIIALITFFLNKLTYNNIVDYISVIATNIASLLGLYLFYHNRTIRKTIFWRLLNISIAILLIGVWMKIIHLSSANIVLTIALSFIALIYIMRFIKKDKKMHLDYLKLFWILSACITANLVFLHIISKDYIIISRILFCLAILDFCLIEYNIIRLNRETIDQ